MIFAWQGWRISLPEDWNPVKLQGNFDKGFALIADMRQPQVGIRWMTPGRKFNARDWASRALGDEVGQLAAREAVGCASDNWRDAVLYTEAKPPGRDVWMGRSSASGRMLELVHHVRKGERSRMESLRGSLSDAPVSGELEWAAFDLSCRSPAGWRLESQVLNAGDLRVRFVRRKERMFLRQIAVAHLALKRMPMEEWLGEQRRSRERKYRQMGENDSVRIQAMDGRELLGLSCRLKRRRWYWGGETPREISILALHDEPRDKLLLMEAEDREAQEEMARSVGWADEVKS